MKKIILILNHGNTRSALKIILESNGFTVAYASSIRNVLQCEDSFPDIVLLDLSSLDLIDPGCFSTVDIVNKSIAPVVCMPGYVNMDGIPKGCFSGVLPGLFRSENIVRGLQGVIH